MDAVPEIGCFNLSPPAKKLFKQMKKKKKKERRRVKQEWLKQDPNTQKLKK